VEWEDPALYDMVLNLERMEIEEACEAVVAAASQRRLEEGPGFYEVMEGLALASKVNAQLVLDPKTAKLELDVTAHKGAVSVKGKASSEGAIRQVRRVAEAVPGVVSLDLELLVPQENL
jgi:osmotically-inducible protein OsmY